jgi:hypothetical protein
MSALSVLQRDRNKLHKWFGTNRGTHWTIAASVIIFSSYYLIYNSRDGNPTPTNPAAERAPAPTAPGPFTLKR